MVISMEQRKIKFNLKSNLTCNIYTRTNANNWKVRNDFYLYAWVRYLHQFKFLQIFEGLRRDYLNAVVMKQSTMEMKYDFWYLQINYCQCQDSSQDSSARTFLFCCRATATIQSSATVHFRNISPAFVGQGLHDYEHKRLNFFLHHSLITSDCISIQMV